MEVEDCPSPAMMNQNAAMRPRLRAITALLTAAAGLLGCRPETRVAAQGQLPPPPVSVMEVQPRTVPIYAEFAGQTYARDMVEVRGRVDGYVEKWLFKPGSEVQAGQVLYILDLRPYEASVAQAKGDLAESEANLEFAKRQVALLTAEANLTAAQASLVKARQDYERLQPLVKEDAAAQQDLDAATAALRAGEANVKAYEANVEQTRLSTRTQIEAMQGKVEALRGALRTAELNLQYSTIRAPISGRVGDSLVPVGGLVTRTSSQPLTTIVPLDPIWVRFKVSEAQYLAYTREKHSPAEELPLELILADGTVHPWKGQISNSLNQVDPKTGTLELQARFPNPKHNVLPGQFGRVRIQVEQRQNALLVPQKAVQELQNMQSVLTVGPENKALARGVVTGERVGSLWIIEKGLRPGDRVIVEGQLKVRPGMPVNPMPYRDPEAASGSK